MEPGLRHQGCIYATDAEFLAMAIPFTEEGLRRGEPVLAATTAHNWKLLKDALGADAGRIGYADTANFGRRASQWSAVLRGYWTRGRSATPTGTVRIIAEPVWAGRSRREMAVWHRMEAGLTVSLADTGVWLICPYDARVVDAGIIEDARRTHPECVVGRRAEPSAQFMVPEEFAGSRPAVSAPDSAADLFRFEGDLVAVRRYVLEKASPILLAENTVAMFDVAVGAVLANLIKHGIDRVSVWVRPVAGRVVCTMHCDQPAGLLFPVSPPPGLKRPDNDLRLGNLLCEWLDISSSPSGCTIELAMPGQRSGQSGHSENEDLRHGV